MRDCESVIQHVELELSSHCNAACLSCARTTHSTFFRPRHLRFDEFCRIFGTKSAIKDKFFNLSGGLGDPLVNPEILRIVEYIIEMGGKIRISTNGSLGSPSVWTRLGELSKESRRLKVSFAVDGFEQTNHLYRRGVPFDKIKRNMRVFTDEGNRRVKGVWTFIPFRHNEIEIEPARSYAQSLGLEFELKLSVRNLDEQIYQVEGEEFCLHPASQFLHSAKSGQEGAAAASTVRCRHLDDQEVYITADLEVWPCCHLWTQDFKQDFSKMKNLKAIYGEDFNSLKRFSLNEILNHVWFSRILRLSFNFDHILHNSRCIEMCRNNYYAKNEKLKLS